MRYKLVQIGPDLWRIYRREFLRWKLIDERYLLDSACDQLMQVRSRGQKGNLER